MLGSNSLFAGGRISDGAVPVCCDLYSAENNAGGRIRCVPDGVNLFE